MATSAISTARRKTTQRVDDLINKRIHELTDRPRLIFLVPSLAGGGLMVIPYATLGSE